MSEKRTIDDVVKKDREYWTAVMDDALIDALLHQHHLGNRNGSVFTTHAYDNIVKELREKFEKPIDKQKVKNRIKTIKYNWSDCYDVFKNGLSGFAWSPITKMWSAEPEVWESLIQAKPKAKELKNKPIPNYDKLVELYGKDRATGEQSETALEMRQRWATSTGEGSMENIEDIDHLVAQNEVTLESCDNVGDNNVGEASSKAKKRKTSKNEDMEQIMGAIQDVALAMREGNLIFERSLARLPIPEQDVFHLLDEIGIDSRLRMRAYLYLIKNLDMLRAFIGYPVEERKELLFTMMSSP
ncbi:uncharacterized protein LOC126720527 isoform X2 [Quercus robur]|uniref:uncharacterized protein LOC126720527 isoform X2 n=1 Tax=Quercus robur TaxID=38942 RepID=UPI0021625825|nr:uncharacterized protein LOC126720527 isoform X2 [Quercus robur]